MPPPERDPLSEVYDAPTLRRLARAGRGRTRPAPPATTLDDEAVDRIGWAPRREHVPVRGPRRVVGAGAFVAATGLGLAEVLDPTEREAVVEEVEVDPRDEEAAVEVHLVPGHPRLSWAVVRPWLLGR